MHYVHYESYNVEAIECLKEVLNCEEYQKIINVQDYVGNTPLHAAVDLNNHKILKLLLGRGADYTLKNDEYKTPLMKAKESGNKRCIHILKKFIREQKLFEIKEPDVE